MNTMNEYLTFARRREPLAKRMRDLKADVDAWNRLHPEQQPIELVLDVTADVAELEAVGRQARPPPGTS